MANGADGSAIACQPFGQCTAKIATSMVTISGRLIQRTARPHNSNTAPPASLSAASTTAQLTGGYTFINALDASSVHLFVDVSGLEEGVYTLPVQIHIDNAPEFTCALSSPEVTVTLQAKP